MNSQSKPVTIKDVARKAGVAPSTVSLVLNRSSTNGRISESTQSRVREAAEDLNYRPNLSARSLRSRESFMFGLVTFDATDPYYMELTRGAEEVIHQAGYNFLLSDVQNDEEKLRAYFDVFDQRGVDGLLIIANTYLLKDSAVRELTESNIPVVIIGRHLTEADVPSIAIDNQRGGFLATEHLIESGHKRIGFILGSPGLVDSEQRWKGARQALQKYGLQCDPGLVVED